MHVLLWRAGNLVNLALQDRRMGEILALLEKQGMRVRRKPHLSTSSERVLRSYPFEFLAVPNAYQTTSGLMHDLDVHVWQKFDRRSAGLRLRGKARKLSELQTLYPKGSLGRDCLESGALRRTLAKCVVGGAEACLLPRLEFVWQVTTANFAPGCDITVLGSFVCELNEVQRDGTLLRLYPGVELELQAFSLLVSDRPPPIFEEEAGKVRMLEGRRRVPDGYQPIDAVYPRSMDSGDNGFLVKRRHGVMLGAENVDIDR